MREKLTRGGWKKGDDRVMAGCSPLAPPAAAFGLEHPSEFIDLIASRRSVSPKWLGLPGPTSCEVEQMIEVAVTAPDHDNLRPWRFLEISGAARQKLGEVFAEAKQRRSPGGDPADVLREKERGRQAPATIAVIACPERDNPKVPVRDQYLSLGAAIQNILLCCHAMGYGAKTLSGAKVHDPYNCKALGVKPNEELLCFICIGTPQAPPKKRPRPSATEHLTRWTGESAED